MLGNIIHPGDKLDLVAVAPVQHSDGSIGKKNYKTVVSDILSDDRIEIVMPMEGTKLILLPVDGEYDVCFFTPGGMYQCYVRIIERYKTDKNYLLVIELTSNLRKFQRREYYRFACLLEMETRILKEEEIEAIEKNMIYRIKSSPLKQAIIVDISGGGLRFVSKEQYEAGSMIFCKYQLVIDGYYKEYNIVGRVLTNKSIEHKKDEFEHRVEYVGINNSDREEIIKFIFAEERKNRKNEKGC